MDGALLADGCRVQVGDRVVLHPNVHRSVAEEYGLVRGQVYRVLAIKRDRGRRDLLQLEDGGTWVRARALASALKTRRRQGSARFI